MFIVLILLLIDDCFIVFILIGPRDPWLSIINTHRGTQCQYSMCFCYRPTNTYTDKYGKDTTLKKKLTIMGTHQPKQRFPHQTYHLMKIYTALILHKYCYLRKLSNSNLQTKIIISLRENAHHRPIIFSFFVRMCYTSSYISLRCRQHISQNYIKWQYYLQICYFLTELWLIVRTQRSVYEDS